MAKKQREEPNTSEWMNTYSDLVTLLLCFFVLLFSMSTINAEKWENFVKAFANPGDKTMQVVIDALDLELFPAAEDVSAQLFLIHRCLL